ncbi:hypothetical protein LUZ62_039019 [Rhynchospora pubera]|uniref:WRKY domain-containing protein n=1 Tax=Rhynchospora pubera TaxID=906938 RepID=A0AAV8FAH1_9POAL|nr:hypothetical protein LUZ62_039019 [Rhynchospora pubera]
MFLVNLDPGDFFSLRTNCLPQRYRKGMTMETFRPKQLRFEDYISFFRNSNADHLTVRQLNQVEVIDAASSLHLMQPTRSTIYAATGIAQLSISCMSPLSLSELKKDIRDIEWQECPIGSVLTVNPVALQASDEPISPVSCLTALPGQDGWCSDIVRERIAQDESRNSIALPAMNGKEDAGADVMPKIEKTTRAVPLRRKNADGYSWKRGVQFLKVLPIRRKYYRCKLPGCKAKKYVDHDLVDPSVSDVTYRGEHNHTIS